MHHTARAAALICQNTPKKPPATARLRKADPTHTGYTQKQAYYFKHLLFACATATMNYTSFWLIRHGETDWNAQRRLQGWIDIPLNPKGVRQAEQLALALHPPGFDVNVDVIISSDLSRAAETARIASGHLGKPVETYASLRERNYGIYEGQDWAKLEEIGVQAALRSADAPITNGETLQEFNTRIRQAFEHIATLHAGQKILVFSHGGVIDMAWRLCDQQTLEAPRPGPILNTSINEFSIYESGKWVMREWGKTAHLDTVAFDDVG